MKPLKLTLKGFTGISAGRKKEVIELDLEKIEGELVTLTGPNGAGKSTILDNMHPFRIMPSRAASNSPSAFSYYDNLASSEAEKVLDWEHEGQRYRSILTFHVSGARKKGEAYLYTVGSDGNMEPVTAPDGTVADGKLDTYDRVLESIVGTAEMFFTSVFASQNRRPLFSYGNAEIKQILAELLGLDKIRELGKKASQVVALIKPRLMSEQVKLTALENNRESLTALHEEAGNWARRKAQCLESRSAQQAALQLAQESAAELKSRFAATEALRQRRSSLERQIADAKDAFAGRRHQCAQRQLDIRCTEARETARLKNEIAASTRRTEQARGTIDRLTRLMENESAIRSAKNKLDTLRKSLSDAESATQKAQDDYHEAIKIGRSMDEEIRSHSVALTSYKTHGEAQAKALKDMEARSTLIENVPCHGTDLQGRCQLLSDATHAKEQIPHIRISLDKMREEYRRVSGMLENTRANREKLALDDSTVKANQSRVTAIQAEIRSLETLADQSSALENASQELDNWNKVLEDASKEIELRQQQLLDIEKQASEGIARAGEELENESAIHAKSIQELADALSSCEIPENLEGEVAKKQTEVGYIGSQIAILDGDILEATEMHAKCIANAQHVEETLSTEPETKALVALLSNELAQWSLLQKAFGNDGIIALSIDDAGPTLTSYTNDLLMSCYGPRFTVSIQTQVQTAKGEAREGFDIIVFDADTQKGKSVSTMSGGERVWINEALTRAIAIYLAQSTGQTYQTLYTDEADGPLDPQRKRMFMAMKREVLRIGGYEREYFITQTPDLWEMADTIIDVSAL